MYAAHEYLSESGRKCHGVVVHWLSRPLSIKSCSDKSIPLCAEPASVERFVLHQVLLKITQVIRKLASKKSEYCAACNTVHTPPTPPPSILAIICVSKTLSDSSLNCSMLRRWQWQLTYHPGSGREGSSSR